MNFGCLKCGLQVRNILWVSVRTLSAPVDFICPPMSHPDSSLRQGLLDHPRAPFKLRLQCLWQLPRCRNHDAAPGIKRRHKPGGPQVRLGSTMTDGIWCLSRVRRGGENNSFPSTGWCLPDKVKLCYIQDLPKMSSLQFRISRGQKKGNVPCSSGTVVVPRSEISWARQRLWNECVGSPRWGCSGSLRPIGALRTLPIYMTKSIKTLSQKKENQLPIFCQRYRKLVISCLKVKTRKPMSQT